MSTQTDPLILFEPKLPKLSKSEKIVLKLLVEAGKLIVPLYLEQENQMMKNGNFYPKGVNEKEVLAAAKKDPSILSPFTVVEKLDGKLVAIPYHIKYADSLKPISRKLLEAAQITNNKEFGRFLKLQAKALTDGSYEVATAAWLKMKPYIIDIYIGPAEHFDDQLFFAKAAYQAWTGVLDLEGTDRLNKYKSIILRAKREALIPGERLENYEKVKAVTIDVIVLSGLMARKKFVGMNLPMNLEFVEKYGSQVTIFNQVNDLRMKEQIIPTFNKVFSPAFKKEYSFEDLRRGSLRYVALHELAHHYLFYKHSAENLQDLLHVVYELTATLLAARIAGSLLLKDVINNKQLESMIITFICRSLDLIEQSRKDKTISNYALQGTIFINFMLEKGALKKKGDIFVTNFMKIFIYIQELSYTLERLLAMGTRKDAENLIKKYGGL